MVFLAQSFVGRSLTLVLVGQCFHTGTMTASRGAVKDSPTEAAEEIKTTMSPSRAAWIPAQVSSIPEPYVQM